MSGYYHSERLEVFARREPFMMDEVELLVVKRVDEGGNKSVFFAAPVNLVKQTPESVATIPTPTVSLTGAAAQQLMDELWRCGLRPTEGSGSAGALAATQRHLEDMRKLALGPRYEADKS